MTDNKHDQKLQAVLLADSFMTSFRPISLDKMTPKVLCPLNNITMLDYSIEFLAGAGVEELYVFCVTGGETVEAYVEKSSWTSSIKVQCVRDSSVTNTGDALRELDKRNLIKSDPFILMSGDVVTNVDIVPALREHQVRHKKDSSAIMTVLLKRVGGWSYSSSSTSADSVTCRKKRNSSSSYRASQLRSLNEDLVVAMNTAHPLGNRILLYDNDVNKGTVALPTSFFESNAKIEVRNDMLDTGIYICSPDVLARFSDEFDYLFMNQFISNSVAEEEEGLQSKIYATVLKQNEYAARIHDPRTYHAVSRDLLNRWCYPIVPDNLPSGYEKVYRYEMHRHMVYVEQKDGKTKVGRSTTLKGPSMIGSGTSIGENCLIQGTVIGNDCNVSNNTVLKDSHLWENVTVEEDVIITESILCSDCLIKKGAHIPKGCIIGRGCVIGENVSLPEFTRITLCKDANDDDDDFDDFNSADDDDDDEELVTLNEDDLDKMEESISDHDSNRAHSVKGVEFMTIAEITDHNIVGKDGWGRVWVPTEEEFEEFNDDSDYDMDDDDSKDDGRGAISKRIEERIKSQSIGYDATDLFRKRMEIQEEMDYFSDDGDSHGANGTSSENVDFDGGFGNSYISQNNLDEDGFLITGRQAGVDVVKEMKLICLDHDVSSPIDNLRIELNSFKFSQNATFGDCVSGAMLAVLERTNIVKDITSMKLVASFKNELKHWAELFRKLCHSIEEEKSVITALESAACGGGIIGDVLAQEPNFRFILQTLHDADIISEEAILSWGSMRRDVDPESAEGKIFLQKHTQEFLEWLNEDSSDEDDSDDDDDDDGSDSESE